ncbi:MAG: hypothetical protein ABR532_01135 [Candidatus Dormibacteria bacterium]
MGDPVGQDSGLAAAGAREDEQRPVAGLNGPPLRLIEGLQG